MQLAVGGFILLVLLFYLSIREIYSKKNQNGVEVESPIYYLLTTTFMALVPFFINPASGDPLFYFIAIMIPLLITAFIYYRLPKITVYQVEALFTVKVIRRVLDHLGYEYTEIEKKTQITESHSYQFHLNNNPQARIELIWPQDPDAGNKEKDIRIKFHRKRKIENAAFLHDQIVEALRLVRADQKFSKQRFNKNLMSLFTLVIPVAFLFFFIL